MHLLVTGAHGQVGYAVAALARQRPWDVRAFAREDLDITDAETVDRAVADARGRADGPLAVVNAAAYTAVDRAEAEREAAFAVNRDGAANLARACDRHGAALVHLSTDYVFDGTKGAPYEEDNVPNPLGVYGASKWAGEEAVRENLERHAILRTAWVFSARGHNFARTMWRLAHERDEIRVVADQTGHPTWAGHLAQAALTVAEGLASGGETGTFHVAGSPATTWHGLARVIVQAAEASGASPTRVIPISTAEYPTAAARPPEARLDLTRIREAYGIGPMDWREGVSETVAALSREA